MGKISNTTQYPTVTPASGDYMVATDVSDSNNTKTVTVGSMASPMLGSLPSATPQVDDKLIGLDTSDSDNAKKFVVSDVFKAPSLVTADVANDHFLLLDASDSSNPKKALITDITSLSGYVVAMDAKTSANQTLAGTATKTQVLLGGAETNTHADLSAAGTITLKSLGNYMVQTNFNIGNVSSTASTVHVEYYINGVRSSLNSMTFVLPASADIRNMSATFPVKVTSVNTTVEFFFAVESGGNAGFVGTSTSISGIAGSPPTAVAVYRAQ